MSARARRPTDEVATEIYDPAEPRGRGRPAPSTLPAPAGPPPPVVASARSAPAGPPSPTVAPLTPLFESFEQDVTELTPIPVRAVEFATPTEIDAPGEAPGAPAAPGERRRGLERSEPIRVISMKDQTEAAKQRNDEARVPLHVQLRSMAEVAGRSDTPVKLGRLAPPRDPRAARARHVRANAIWVGVAMVLAGAIALAIWLIAGR